MLHRLEVINLFAELLAFQEVWQGGIETALRQTNHLSTDADTAFVQISRSVLVTVTDCTENGIFVHTHVIEVKHASARRTNAQFVFLFADDETGGIAIDNECCNTFVALRNRKKELLKGTEKS